MATDTLENRICKLTLNEGVGKTTVTDKTITIGLGASLPILLIDQAMLASKTVASLTDAAAISLDNIVNGLSDPVYLTNNGVERFTYIGTGSSSVSLSKIRVYYDAKYKDIFIIPDIVWLGDNTPTDPTNGHSFTITGYHVGTGMSMKRQRSNHDIPLDTDFTYDLPLTNSNLPITVDEVRLHGLTPKSDLDMTVGYAIDPNTRVYSSKSHISSIINLGTVGSLFTSVGMIPAYQVYQRSVNDYTMKYLGTKELPATSILYIPLDF